MFVDYNYYINSYFGSDISEPGIFVRYEAMSYRYLDYITQGRVSHITTNDVKNTLCAIADIYYNYDTHIKQHSGLQSQSNDGISVTYRADTIQEKEQLNKDLYSAALMNLKDKKVLYRGI